MEEHKRYSGYPANKAQRVTLNEGSYRNKAATITANNDSRRKYRKRDIPVLLVVLLSFAVIALAVWLCYFVLWSPDKHAEAAAIATAKVTVNPETTPPPTASPTPTPTPVPTVTPEPTPSTMWGANFPGKFTDGEVVQDENSYKSSHVNVSVQKVQKDGVTYYLADIYIADLKYFMTAFADDKYQGDREFVYKVAQKKNAIIAINGDYYKVNAGPVFKNGELYRDEKYKDVLVMFKDGTMQTYANDEFDLSALKGDAWQMWTWGPMLLKDGEPMTEFNLPESVGGANPRTAVGYYEPGHYMFLTVDGRSKDSKGMTMKEMSQFFHDLGCKVAFNLDGGGSAQMAFMGNEINQPCSTYRKDCDILYIAEQQG